MDDDYETYELWAVLAFLRRRWRVIVGTSALVAVVAFVVSIAQSERYEATSTILFRDPGLDQRIFDPPILFGGQGLLGGQNVTGGETAIGLVELGDVADATAESLGGGLDGEAVDEKVLVRGGGSNELVAITASTEDPDESAELANAYAESFLEIRAEVDRAVYRRASAAVDRRLAALGPALASSAEAQRLRDQRDDLRALQLMQTGDVEPVQLAEPSADPTSPKPIRTTILAGAAGLLLGLIVGLLLDRLDRRLRTRRDFEHAYRSRVVGTISMAGGTEEEFRSLWMRLRYPAGADDPAGAPQSILVVGAGTDAGASTVAIGLAEAAFQTGLAVTLVEADTRAPCLAARVGAAPTPGLVELRRGDANYRDAIHDLAGPAEGKHLRLLPAGDPPPGESAVGGEAVAQLLEDLSSDADLVIVDAPPLGEFADAIPLLGACDVVLIVATAEQPAAVAEALVAELADRSATVAGLVVNRASGRLRPR